ncbi:putative cytochrome P450 hydroxylase [Pseudonocardia sp. Ae168_Ps1]|uniref:cytochrome P450 family protein n=1 Tax=unclassified Pseudonocardia TaxID=2619320 RepID=UPI00094AEF66|nr:MULTISPECIES: cytochrome P450 [unclassified Pseudonocardia]OLL73805.1 putative cytochrome P450 hydroxylase [Pseudonocardia sp. Ae150A_Ps1]OLL79786.1 putative cytochrome P450 hydroxylase [Pseudonocardia sp. Ae168_Ps1]OLL86080.1 putative cytochrome P450 hydroxylase [Pseudonocardia sp. Ae263_Ps1]OLL93889.1 putative cytochrome P450 hydroxylase [Pseudonocardia sp. Ae356_Ps1]
MTASTEPRDLLSPDLTADPYAAYGRMREEAPAVTVTMMGTPPAVMVTRHDDVRTVLTDPRFVTDVELVGGAESMREAMFEKLGVPDDLAGYLLRNILTTDGAEHARLRKLVSRAFTVKRVQALRPRGEEITARLLDRIGDAGRVDLVETFGYPLPITVICELVGVPDGEREQWHEWGRVLTSMDPQRVPAVLRAAVDHVHALVDARRAEPADDLISALVAAQDDDGDRLTDREMVTMIFALVMAGHETTAHLISNGALALLTRPDQLAVLRERPELWPQAVDELMRFRGPVQFTQFRYPTEDVELGGVAIPAGTPVIAGLLPANHDPRAYDRPDELDVGRDTGRGDGHLGFGRGAHYCLGAALARQEGEVALRMLFDRFPDLALDAPAAEIVWVPRPGFSRVGELPVRVS